MQNDCGCRGCHRLNVLCFGLALGIVSALGAFLMGVGAMLSGWGAEMVKLTATTYVGYQATWVGSLIGALWGFIDAFIGGVVFAAIYNCLLRCCKRNKQTGSTSPTFSQH